MTKKPSALRTIEVGEGLEIDDGFEGTIQKKCLRRLQGMRFAQEIQELVQDDPDGVVAGLEKTLKKIGEVYPKIDLKYGEHQFKSIEDLYETDKGEALIMKVLVPKIAGATPLSKN